MKRETERERETLSMFSVCTEHAQVMPEQEANYYADQYNY